MTVWEVWMIFGWLDVLLISYHYYIKCLWISWFPRLCFCGCCRNPEFTITMFEIEILVWYVMMFFTDNSVEWFFSLIILCMGSWQICLISEWLRYFVLCYSVSLCVLWCYVLELFICSVIWHLLQEGYWFT